MEDKDPVVLTISLTRQELKDLDSALRYAMQYVVEDAIKNDQFMFKDSLGLQSFVHATLNHWCKLLVRLNYPEIEKKENGK